MIKTFKEDIHKLTNNEVTVYDKLGTSSTVSGPDPDDDDGSASADASEVPQQHDWVTKMEDFRRALISIHIAETEIATFHPPRVKVCPAPLFSAKKTGKHILGQLITKLTSWYIGCSNRRRS